ncbi:hypothetical protein ACPCTN_02935 [Streptomyces cinereoruber]|uniref:hypothetical protein n=1 Tax=Streptomyces cinereoruber TaxID=67260 RepID=UPI003C2B8E99
MLITNAAVQEAALTLAQRLTLTDPATGTWGIDPEAPADGAAHLIHDDGRGLSFRPVFGGTTAQIWIAGAPAPSLPADATPAERDAHQAQLALRLAAGHRYNKAVTLLTDDDDVDPADLILDTVENHLLPAFTLKPHYVGHRPWDDLFAEALAEANDDTVTPTGTSLRDCGPEAHTRPTPDVEPEVDSAAPEVEPEADSATPDADAQSTDPFENPNREDPAADTPPPHNREAPAAHPRCQEAPLDAHLLTSPRPRGADAASAAPRGELVSERLCP